MVSDIQPLLLRKPALGRTPFKLHFSTEFLGLTNDQSRPMEFKSNLKPAWPLVIRHCKVMRDDGVQLYATECDIQDMNLRTYIVDWRSQSVLAMVQEGIEPLISCPLVAEGKCVPLETFARRCEHEDEHRNVTMQAAGLLFTWIPRDDDGDTYDLVKGRCTPAKLESERVRYATVSGLRSGSKLTESGHGEKVTLTMLLDESIGLLRHCVIATVLIASGVV